MPRITCASVPAGRAAAAAGGFGGGACAATAVAASTAVINPPALRIMLTTLALTCAERSSLLRRDLGAQRFLALPHLGRHGVSEVFGLEHLPDFHLGAAVERGPLQPFDRLVHRLRLPQPEAS